MKHKIYEYLKFELGSESYSYEFEIIPIPPYEIIKDGISLEPHEYFGEINEILGYKVRQVILYYNADVLMKVEIKFKGNILHNLIQTITNLNIDFTTIMFLKMYHDAENGETVLMYKSRKINASEN